MKNNKSTILLIVLLLVALVGAMALSKQSQETRRGAYFAGTKILLQPDAISKNVGEDVLVNLYLNTGMLSTGQTAKADFIETKLCYGDSLSIGATPATSITLDPAFTTIMKAKSEEADVAGYNNCLTFAAKAEKAEADLKSGTIRVAQLKFKAVKAGTGKIAIIKDKSMVSGFNPNASSTDASLEITNTTDANYTITGGSTTNDSYLNFKMAFAGVTEGAQCADWKVQVMVLGPNNQTKTYNDVTLTEDAVTASGLQSYRVGLRLTGFVPTSNVAVFVKGPKQLQVKYGIDGQVAYYNKVGGELTGLTNNSATSPIFDFTGYPLLAGDVTGDTAGAQDGIADGRDFSYIKGEVVKRSSVDPGHDLPADLNGNCAYESQDTALFMLSLKEKQAQLY